MVGSLCSALLLTGLLGAQASTAVVPPGDGPLPPRVAAVPTPDATTPPAEPPPVELPGGGRVLFPGRRLVALYGHPGAPSLGVLGEQGIVASIDRARRVARTYQALSTVPVVPSFEIIATVAQRSAGRDGDYSGESTVA